MARLSDADKRIEAAQKAEKFTVEGDGEFPLDMLRYDLCWPATERDAMVIGQYRKQRTVELRSLKAHPTRARWNSFGWDVV